MARMRLRITIIGEPTIICWKLHSATRERMFIVGKAPHVSASDPFGWLGFNKTLLRTLRIISKTKIRSPIFAEFRILGPPSKNPNPHNFVNNGS